MFKIKYLRNILLVSILILITLPVYNIFFVYPSFRELLQKEAEDESVRVVSHWITMLNPEKLEISSANLPKDLLLKSRKLEKDFGLKSLKVFAPSGEILYSADPKEIGSINNTEVFHEIVAKGLPHTHIVNKGEKVDGGQVIDSDIVETYVPLLDKSKFLGAFEVYYDISSRKKNLDKIIIYSSVLQFSMVLGLFLIVFNVLTKAKITIENQKKAEESLATSETRYRTLVENARDVIFTLSKDGLITSLNPAFEIITGWSRNDWLGKHFMPIISPKDKEAAADKLTRVLSGESLPMFELNILAQSGQFKTIEFSISPKIKNAGEIIGVIGFGRDITNVRKAEQFVEDILQSVDEGFTVIDKDYRIITANAAFCRMSRKEVNDIIGRYCYEVSHAIDIPCHEHGEECSVRHTFQTGQTFSSLHTHKDATGGITYVDTSSYPIKNESGDVISVIETFKDVTEKKNLETQLQQIQKMEAIGTLAGGVAHDFNNILNVIIGFSDLMQMKMRVDDPLQSNLNEIIAAANRATELTHRLLAFSRKQIINPKPVDLNELIKGLQKMLKRLITENIKLNIRLSDDAMIVMADSGQIEQVLMNLVVNARDAMPQGGLLEIKTQTATVSGHQLHADDSHEIKDYSHISVSDSGNGMDAETKAKAFDPFFTTKEQGKGTGLGLSMVYGILKQHAGYITIRSEVGKGTTFDIYLPIVKQGEERETAKTLDSIPFGTETILVVEDDRQSRNILSNILEEFYYTVIEASDGAEAVEKFLKHKDTVQMIIMDVIMPKMNGKEAYEAIKKIKPDIKILFISGYTDDIIHKHGILDEDLNFINKPVRPDTLLKKIREILDHPA